MSNNKDIQQSNAVKLANKEPFSVIVVDINKIQHLDWNKSTYLNELVNGDYNNIVKINPERYVEEIGTLLNVDKQIHKVIDTKVIAELYMDDKHNMIIEIMFNVHEEDGDGEDINEFATLLNVYDNNIYGKALIMCTMIANNTTEMYFTDITVDIIEMMLQRRANTTVITFDADEESYKEVCVFGPMDRFADDFFSENKYKIKKKELGFLKHNINVWYTEDKYGVLDCFGNILEDTARVDKMIVFAMWTDEYRHNLTMREFEMIRFLSKKLDQYEVSEDIMKEEKDEYGRMIIKNKYKILHMFYNMNK